MIVYRELSSIEAELGIELKTLYAVSNTLDRHYRKVSLPKKGGGTRTLLVPSPILKKIQRAIVEKLLVFRPVSHYAKAYKLSASVKKNALPHVGKAKIVKLDILHFFDSILYSSVKDKAFPASLFDEKIRVLLSMLCYYRDSLPQGAPSSPIISNIVLFDFDEKIGAYCRERTITYTRYCDDLTFSGNFDETELIGFVKEELKSNGFFLNPRKTAIVPREKRQTVTGIVVNEKLNVAKEYRRAIRQEMHYIETYGICEHLKRSCPNVSPDTYLHSLLGRIGYVLSVSPDDAAMLRYRQSILALLHA